MDFYRVPHCILPYIIELLEMLLDHLGTIVEHYSLMSTLYHPVKMGC